MSTSLKVGAWYKPVKLLEDQPEPRAFILQDIYTRGHTALIQYEDTTLEEVHAWFIEYYCTRIDKEENT
jgi:hypothetical protein